MRKQDDIVNQSGKAPEDGVLDLVHRVMHQYRSLQYQVLREGPHDITHMESKVLGYVGHHPGATQSELAQQSGPEVSAAPLSVAQRRALTRAAFSPAGQQLAQLIQRTSRLRPAGP